MKEYTPFLVMGNKHLFSLASTVFLGDTHSVTLMLSAKYDKERISSYNSATYRSAFSRLVLLTIKHLI